MDISIPLTSEGEGPAAKPLAGAARRTATGRVSDLVDAHFAGWYRRPTTLPYAKGERGLC
jgi:hypothetical protein